MTFFLIPLHSGYFPIVPGSESLFMSSSCHSVFKVIKNALGRYYNYKISGSHQKILQEIMKTRLNTLQSHAAGQGYKSLMLSNAQQCSAMLGNAQQCSAMLSNAQQCSAMLSNAQQ